MRWPPFLRAFARPVIEEERAAARDAWDALPTQFHTPDQSLGRWNAGCGATWGVMERCDFACTACYLGKGANKTEPLPFDEVKEQLDTMRRHLGPGGRVQITAGEVTLLPCDDLIRILNYARSLHLIPMVMTHGQRFLREPAYLERLVVDGGLDRVAIHVDTTQRGRDGGDPDTEAALMPVRDRMAELVRATRRRTKRPLIAAHTFTVTRDNLAEVPAVVRWTVRNADAFRMLSLQPLAQVGRTRTHGRPDSVWEAVYEGLGRRIHNQTWEFGHRDCNQFAFLWACGKGDKSDVVEVARADSRLDRWFLRRLLKSGVAGWTMNGESTSQALARLAGRLVRDPRLLLEVPLFCAVRLVGDARLLKRPRAFAINVHNFMDADELDTPLGKERLSACVFKVPVDGRMVSMCEFNGGGLRAARTDEMRSPVPMQRT
ncbi:MAG: hypothetical protein OER88_12790 [Planctomycetota bacterium]|nr:hypothetical protein [Planctomycetota bacterium]